VQGGWVVFEGCDLKRWKVWFKGRVSVVSANLNVAVNEVLTLAMEMDNTLYTYVALHTHICTVQGNVVICTL